MEAKVKLNLRVKAPEWPDEIPECEPFVVRLVHSRAPDSVVIKAKGVYVFFEIDGGISRTEDEKWVKDYYQFERFLSRLESFCIIGGNEE